MSNRSGERRSEHFRLREIGLFGLLLLVALGTRLYQLQVLEHLKYSSRANNNTVAAEAITPPRGRILDREQRILVSNAPQFELVVVPGEMRQRRETIEILSELLREDIEVLHQKIMDAHPLAPLPLKRDLDQGELTRFTQVAEKRSGVSVKAGSIRRYPHGTLASHIFGYTSEINAEELRVRRGSGYAAGDQIGKLGLEKQYDQILRGQKGSRQVFTDVLGRTVSSHELKPPQAGPDLILTLDLEVQKAAEASLAATLEELALKNGERSGGAVVVMEVNTGALKAMACLPQYDPKLFSRGITSSEYQKLLDDPGYPLVNRLIHSAFSPGSVFKLVTGTAGLQNGNCRPGTIFFCGGSYAGANCFARGGHGSIDFENSVAHSCNVVYYQLGVQMGIDRLVAICSAYGLGKPTGVDLPGEVGGLLPDPAWKQKVWEDRWYEGDTVNLSIGQGFLLVSPLQMAVVTAAVANGGTVVTPYLAQRAVLGNGKEVYQNKAETRDLGIEPEFLASMRRGMRGAVTHGTSTAAYLEHLQVAGKTGTIESFPSVSNPKGRNHVWFVSFAPYENPEYTVVVFLEKSGGFGGSLAAPIATDVYRHLYPAPGAQIGRTER